MKPIILWVLVVLGGAASGAVAVEDIVIRDAAGNHCIQIEVGVEVGEVLVFGQYEPQYIGIPGAEFRIDGIPQSWLVTWAPNPAASLSLNNPFQGGGNIGFPNCQVDASHEILLGSAQVFATTAEAALLEVQGHSTPSNPNFPCPIFYFCEIIFSARCVATGPRAVVNGGDSCLVAVSESTWTGVKSLYR